MRSKKIPSQKNIYHIMHIDKKAAEVDETSHCKVFLPPFMPYHLYLEEADDMDTLVNNVTNFYYWCSTRLLTLDRTYAKEILNSIGVRQAVTDRNRARIALSCRCASMEAFEVYAQNHDLDIRETILKLDRHNYYMMNIIDYLVGNTDRHWATGASSQTIPPTSPCACTG